MVGYGKGRGDCAREIEIKESLYVTIWYELIGCVHLSINITIH